MAELIKTIKKKYFKTVVCRVWSDGAFTLNDLNKDTGDHNRELYNDDFN